MNKLIFMIRNFNFELKSQYLYFSHITNRKLCVLETLEILLVSEWMKICVF